jgi:hypothetical protein
MDDVTRFNDDEAYYSDRTYLSNSSLKLLKKSPTKFHLWRQGKWSWPSASYFDVGQALHSLFLEGKDISVKWNGTRRGNDYKEFCAENEGKLILPNKDYDTVHGMYDKLQKVQEVTDLMGFDFQAEVPAVMDWYTETGEVIKLKGKADSIVTGEHENYLVDLKTTAKPLDEWTRNARWMYAQQAYLYTELFNLDEFYFLVIEKEFPYEVGIYRASESFLELGARELDKSIELYQKLFLSGEFRPYYAHVGEL